MNTQYRISDTWTPLSNLIPNQRDLSSYDSANRTWKKSIEFKTTIRVLGNHHIVAGKIHSSYFGFRVSDNNLTAIYNAGDGNGEIGSVNLAILNTFGYYRLEAISNVCGGTISFYLDNTLIHLCYVNTTEWDDNNGDRLWMIDSEHGVVKFRQFH